MPKDIKILLSLAKGCSDELKKKGAKEGAEEIVKEDAEKIAKKIMEVGVFVVKHAINIGKHAIPIIKEFLKNFKNIPLKDLFKSQLMSQLTNVTFQAFTVIGALTNEVSVFKILFKSQNWWKKLKKKNFLNK